MRPHRNAYELSESQVSTPPAVVALFWRVIKRHRSRVGKVLDLGAGDCRFSVGGAFSSYVGVEIDRKRVVDAKAPLNGRLVHGCAFEVGGGGFDACIGNPPYARHHDVDGVWRERVVSRLEREIAAPLGRHCNLYLYFFCLALLRTIDEGLVALLIPFEWVSRPSARGLRKYIRDQGWDVSVYRFQEAIFPGVLTTASISVVDKSLRSGRWRFYDLTPGKHRVVERGGAVDSAEGVLDYSDRGRAAWCLRGLSPGSQRVFTLTEGERVRAGLGLRDVSPCVTTLRGVPRQLRTLNRAAFEKWFVKAGRRCWLIRSNCKRRSPALEAYIASVPAQNRDTSTCRHQSPWFNFRPHPVPGLLLGSGFTAFGPKVLVNSVRAAAVGSVWGVHLGPGTAARRTQRLLLAIDFERRVVPHARTLKKVEVRQLNSVLGSRAKEGL